MGGRRLLSVALAAIVGAGLVLAPASPALACGTVGCNGLDPVAQGCSVSSYPGQKWITGTGGPPNYGVRLAYSFGCQTFWAVGTKDCNPTYTPLAYVRVVRQLNSPYGYFTSNTYYSAQVPCGGTSNPARSPMVTNYGDDRAQACMAIDTTGAHPSTFSSSKWSWCTRWVYNDVWTTG